MGSRESTTSMIYVYRNRNGNSPMAMMCLLQHLLVLSVHSLELPLCQLSDVHPVFKVWHENLLDNQVGI